MLQDYLNLSTGQVWYLACVIGAIVWGASIGLCKGNWNGSDGDLVGFGLMMGIIIAALSLLLIFHTTSFGAFAVLVFITASLALGIPHHRKRKKEKKRG